MKKGLIKIKVLVDEDIVGTPAYTRMQKALVRQDDNMRKATSGRLGTRVEFAQYDFKQDEIKWQATSYNGKRMYIPTAQYVQNMTDKHRGNAHFLTMVITDKNWKPPARTIGGLNMFLTQVIQGTILWSVYSWFITFEEELVHAFDQMALKELGIDFNKLFDVRSYDFGVVHGLDPRYTRSKYRPLYKKAIDTLIKLFPYDTDEDENASILAVRKVLGPKWVPPPIFYERGLVEAGEVGAVRIEGQFLVRTIGDNGEPIRTPWAYFRKFGTLSQKGIVGVVSAEQAYLLGVR